MTPATQLTDFLNALDRHHIRRFLTNPTVQLWRVAAYIKVPYLDPMSENSAVRLVSLHRVVSTMSGTILRTHPGKTGFVFDEAPDVLSVARALRASHLDSIGRQESESLS